MPLSARDARRLLVEGDLDGAKAACMAILAERPRAPHVHLLLGNIARRVGDTDAMRRHLDDARECEAPALQLTRLEWQWARLTGDTPGALQLLERLSTLEPDADRRQRLAFDATTLRAVELGKSGELDAAWRLLLEASTGNPELAFRREVHMAVGEWIDRDPQQLARLEAAFRTHPRSAGLLWCLAVAYDLVSDVARSRALVQANWHWAGALDPPSDLQVWDFVDLALVSPERADREVRYKALLFANRLEEALPLAPAYQRRLVADAIALSREGRDAMAPVRNPGTVTRSGEGRTGGTVFVFSGLREQVWIPAHVLDVYFAALDLRAVFLRDFERLLFLGEVPGLGNGVAEIAASLRAMAPTGPVYTMGISGGGLAALAYAGALGAERSLAFSPPSTLDPRRLDAMDDHRARAWVRRFVSRVDPTPFDGPALLARMPPEFRLTAYAPADGVEDRRHVERLQDDPRVRVHLVEGTGSHDSIGHASDKVGFLQLCRDALLGDNRGAGP